MRLPKILSLRGEIALQLIHSRKLTKIELNSNIIAMLRVLGLSEDTVDAIGWKLEAGFGNLLEELCAVLL